MYFAGAQSVRQVPRRGWDTEHLTRGQVRTEVGMPVRSYQGTKIHRYVPRGRGQPLPWNFSEEGVASGLR